jgi:hypothetical protein
MYEHEATGQLGGDSLRLLRVSRRVTATSVASHYGASRAAICNIERTIRPRPGTVLRYLRALTAAVAEREAE